MYFVYLLKSINFPEQTYIGCTSNINNRFKARNSGSSRHTAKYKPWSLVTYFAFQDKCKAYDFEKYLKLHAGKAFAAKRFLS